MHNAFGCMTKTFVCSALATCRTFAWTTWANCSYSSELQGVMDNCRARRLVEAHVNHIWKHFWNVSHIFSEHHCYKLNSSWSQKTKLEMLNIVPIVSSFCSFTLIRLNSFTEVFVCWHWGEAHFHFIIFPHFFRCGWFHSCNASSQGKPWMC